MFAACGPSRGARAHASVVRARSRNRQKTPRVLYVPSRTVSPPHRSAVVSQSVPAGRRRCSINDEYARVPVSRRRAKTFSPLLWCRFFSPSDVIAFTIRVHKICTHIVARSPSL